MEESNNAPLTGDDIPLENREFKCIWSPPSYDRDMRVLGFDAFIEDEGYNEEMIDKIYSLAIGETYYPFEDGGHPDHSITRVK